MRAGKMLVECDRGSPLEYGTGRCVWPEHHNEGGEIAQVTFCMWKVGLGGEEMSKVSV